MNNETIYVNRRTCRKLIFDLFEGAIAIMTNDLDLDPDCDTGVYQRFPYTNDIIAAIVLVSVPALMLSHAYGYGDLSQLPSEILLGYLSLAGIAASWTFGRSAVDAWKVFTGGSRHEQ